MTMTEVAPRPVRTWALDMIDVPAHPLQTWALAEETVAALTDAVLDAIGANDGRCVDVVFRRVEGQASIVARLELRDQNGDPVIEDADYALETVEYVWHWPKYPAATPLEPTSTED